MEKVIECTNLHKKYFLFDKDYKVIPWLFTKKGCTKEKETLRNVNLTINKGDVIGFVGKNGAGKSTLMKIIAGITMHTDGQLKVNGKVNSLINLGAGFNQKYTGRQNVYYKGLLMGMTKKDIDKIIDDIIDFCELGEYFDLPIYMYSSGMSARLGFALAVFAEHDILIVDEVFAVGDKAFRDKSAKKMAELFKSGKSIIFASHSDSQIRQFCNRAVFIDNSEIVIDGTVDEVLTAYNAKYAPKKNKNTKRKNQRKKFHNVECKYYKKLDLIRINANIPEEKANRCEIYLGEEHIGNLNQNIYVNDANTSYGSEKWNSYFTKVVKNFDFKRVKIKYYNNDELVTISNYNVIKRNALPLAYTSTAGNRNNIVVKKEDEEKFFDSVYNQEMNKNLKLLSIETSSACNCKCSYCIVGQAYESIERCNISKKVIDEAIKTINKYPSIATVQLNGLGEPLLYKGFVDICKEIYEKTHVRNILFYTNGMFLTESLIDELIKIPFRYNISISIDGKTAEESNITRVGSNYELTKKNLNYLMKKTQGMKNFKLNIHNLVVGDLDDESIPEFLLNEFGNIRIDSHKAFHFDSLSNENLESQDIYIDQRIEKRPCKRCFSQATIRSNGDVIRCHWDYTCELVMGNVLDTPFEDIWNGEKYKEVREIMMSNCSYENLPNSCKKCHAMTGGVLYKK